MRLIVRNCARCGRAAGLVAEMPEMGPIHCADCSTQRRKQDVLNDLTETRLFILGFRFCDDCRAGVYEAVHCRDALRDAHRECTTLNRELERIEKAERLAGVSAH